MNIRYSVNPFIMGKYRGKVLYPFVLFSQAQEDVTDQLFRHELEHVYQIRRNGWFCFYLKYVLLAIRYGYEKHPFELEAEARQDDPLTDEEREIKNG